MLIRFNLFLSQRQDDIGDLKIMNPIKNNPLYELLIEISAFIFNKNKIGISG